MSTRIRVPVVSQQAIKAWPKHEAGGKARTASLADALTQEHRTDAHFAAYAAPANERRLDAGALEHDAIGTLGGAVAMQLALFDVDAASSHKASGGDGTTPAADDWWLSELPKVAALLEAHPGLFVYRTRGGYRIVGVLASAIELREPEHGLVWRRTYLTWVAYLARAFAIVADPVADWQRLMRLPHATRTEGGSPERREVIGDAACVGIWDPLLTAEDRAAGAQSAKKRPAKERAEREPTAREVCVGDGVLFHALDARGDIRATLEPGKFSITCPREHEHSSHGETGTVLYSAAPGETLGWIHCSHSGSGHDRLSVAEWLRCFSDDEIGAARAAAGVDTAAANDEAPAAGTALPTVIIGLDLFRVVDEVSAALGAAETLYQRSGELVQITRAAETDARRGIVQGAPHIRPLAPPTLREMITRVATCVRWDARAQELRPCAPTDNVVSAVHARGTWPAVRPISGVIEAPTIRRDGSVLAEAGYDMRTGVLLAPTCDVPLVPESPTQDEAHAALAVLCEPLAEMPWAGEADRFAVVAGMLTVIGRSAIDGCVPGLAIDANSPGVGKSLVTDVLAIVATGRPAARVTWPETAEELDKVLASYATTGAALVPIDNVTGPVEGGSLDKHLTADRVEIRPLGRSTVLTLPWKALVTITGNGLDVRGDTRRRLLVPRLEADVESPEDRVGWRIPDLRAWCREHRGRLVAAALTVLRAYIVAGRPDVGTKTWGSFEQWAALIPPAIVFAGGVDPMGCRLRAEDDGQRLALMALLSGWARIAPHGETVRGMLAHLYPLDRVRGERAPDGYDDMRSAIEALAPTRQGQAPDVRRVGEALRKIRNRRIGTMRFEWGSMRGGSRVWVARAVGGEGAEGGVVPTLRGEHVERVTNASLRAPGENEPHNHHHHLEAEPGLLSKAHPSVQEWAKKQAKGVA